MNGEVEVLPTREGASHKLVFTDLEIAQIGRLLEQGMPIEEIADFFEVDRSSLHRQMKDPKFAATVHKAKARLKVKTIDYAYKRAFGGSDKILDLIMRTRLGFSEKKVLEIQGGAGVNVTFAMPEIKRWVESDSFTKALTVKEGNTLDDKTSKAGTSESNSGSNEGNSDIRSDVTEKPDPTTATTNSASAITPSET